MRLKIANPLRNIFLQKMITRKKIGDHKKENRKHAKHVREYNDNNNNSSQDSSHSFCFTTVDIKNDESCDDLVHEISCENDDEIAKYFCFEDDETFPELVKNPSEVNPTQSLQCPVLPGSILPPFLHRLAHSSWLSPQSSC